MRHLLAKQIERNGLKKGELTVERKRNLDIIAITHVKRAFVD